MLFFVFLLWVPVVLARLPEESMTAPEIIEYYGYPVEIVEVKTPDGYILHLHRIPYGKTDIRVDLSNISLEKVIPNMRYWVDLADHYFTLDVMILRLISSRQMCHNRPTQLQFRGTHLSNVVTDNEIGTHVDLRLAFFLIINTTFLDKEITENIQLVRTSRTLSYISSHKLADINGKLQGSSLEAVTKRFINKQIFKENFTSNVTRPVVFLQHGLLGSSGDWITNLPNQSAGFVFADAGFDVWLGNVRGNFYSRKHEKYSTFSPNFWKFSWDEMAAYDLPTMIEAVLNITEQESLHYVGHSQGTEIMFAKLSSDPKFGAKLMVRIFGAYEFLPSNWFMRMFAEIICGSSFMNPLCDNVLFQIGGPDTDNFNKSRLMVYLSHVPAGTSTMNIAHWAQMTRSKTVQKFDYGTTGNLKVYNQTTPPLYDYKNVNVPTYLYYSTQDWLSDPIDVQNSLLDVIPKNFLKLTKNLVDYDHFDFVWGVKANERIYQDVIRKIKSYENIIQRRKPTKKCINVKIV